VFHISLPFAYRFYRQFDNDFNQISTILGTFGTDLSTFLCYYLIGEKVHY